ncbi:pyridoxamine 5'-phosphate oxidase family protein [Hahella sp. KA22]|uniref:pyridoxamine 5'-phosphate oxidase family protein n=1 Tax=Hahella sp. KA22 TaxID=1628392 RepID=UPI000FDF1622|nr:pyridoxamine 5'-phosphate oxidase family protein [Hahella sp. KA22]AZZ92658.1 pyridoxamine 5'-phosphate oxidase family protein [Hahella sp. KA22]QAY56031.1 pyridoxamine 5'-phosphate oxidase family protein [Hahella sp. KA22]
MGQQFSEISDKLTQFIQEQKLFFVGTAAREGRVNISPKGMDSLRVLGPNRVIWLNVTGSGNETSAHIQECPRMTVMFAAFEGNPLILRLYGEAKVIHRNDPEWEELLAHFNPIPGARQIFDLNVDLVQSSCGMAVPFYDYVEDRELLKNWAAKKGDEGVKDYWKQKNELSLDGKETHIVEKSV